MLILSRKKDEEIIIQLPNGVVVTIMVVDVNSNKVKLGITAPRDVPVDRREIFELKKSQGENKLLENSAEQQPVAIN